MANTNLLDHLDIFPKAPRLNIYSVDGKPNWSQQHYAAAREKKEKEKKNYLSKHHVARTAKSDFCLVYDVFLSSHPELQRSHWNSVSSLGHWNLS